MQGNWQNSHTLLELGPLGIPLVVTPYMSSYHCRCREGSNGNGDIRNLREKIWRNDMNVTKAIVFGAVILVGLTAWTQEFPKIEAGVTIPTCASLPAGPTQKGTV